MIFSSLLHWALLAAILAPLSSMAQTKPGQTFRDCAECPEMVVVPPGRVTMGSSSGEAGRDAAEGPQTEITIAKPFAVGKFELTRAQFAAFVNATGYKPASACGYRPTITSDWAHDKKDLDWRNPGVEQKDDHPVLCASWNDAKAYAAWLSTKTKRAYRLLSDAEWEYVARAGVMTSRPWGDKANDACQHANVADLSRDRKMAPGKPPSKGIHNCDDGFAGTAPVGSFKANSLGLHDMVGNAWEWVEDCWHATLIDIPKDGTPRLGGNCNNRTVRGGSWYGPPPGGVRLAKRSFAGANMPYFNLGIRVATTP